MTQVKVYSAIMKPISVSYVIKPVKHAQVRSFFSAKLVNKEVIYKVGLNGLPTLILIVKLIPEMKLTIFASNKGVLFVFINNTVIMEIQEPFGQAVMMNT